MDKDYQLKYAKSQRALIVMSIGCKDHGKLQTISHFIHMIETLRRTHAIMQIKV